MKLPHHHPRALVQLPCVSLLLTPTLCQEQEQPVEGDSDVIYLAGIIDTTSYSRTPDLFEFTIHQINERQGTLFQDVLQEDDQRLRYTLSNSDCDETTAVNVYWELRTAHQNQPPDGIVGAGCSGASVSLARISQQEQVPQVSPASNSAKLSQDDEFPFFSRLVAPNDESGEVGALVALMDHLEWDHVTVLSTDTQFAKDLTTEFRKTFAGTVAYSDTIPVASNGRIEEDVLKETLDKIPRGHKGSRIIMLAAHSQHAFEVLQKAHQTNFQPDTVWVGSSSWIDRQAPSGVTYDLPQEFPGYLGVAPFRNRNAVYQEFLSDFRAWLRQNDKDDYDVLPTYASETVDSIVALTTALSQMPVSLRRSPRAVNALRELDFEGVSGRVQFTTQGDRKDPVYSIVNAYGSILNDDHDTPVTWNVVGSVGTQLGSVQLESDYFCFAELGCTTDYPSDTYPTPPTKLPGWAWFLLVVFALLFGIMAYKYLSSRRKKEGLKKELNAFRSSVVGMRAAECDYIPRVTLDEEKAGVRLENAVKASFRGSTSTNSTAVKTSFRGSSTTTTTTNTAKPSFSSSVTSSVTGTFSLPVAATVQWCWKETASQMYHHQNSDIFGDPADGWIKYNDACNKKLEADYQAKKKSCSPLDGYKVTFNDMKQTKTKTKFQRDVLRVVEKNDTVVPNEIHLDGVRVGDALPKDLEGEPQMVLIESDIVQISKQRDDGWAFGTKLHHADEAAARSLVSVAAGVTQGEVAVDANVFPDTGWFRLDCTRVPLPDDLEALKQNVGDTGALDAPSHWDDVKDPTAVEKHELKQGDQEYDKVHAAFMSTLQPTKTVKVVKIQRIQNLAMWQSYIVKRQTICYRETGHTAGSDGNKDDVMRKALARFERSWLWHGTNAEVMDKIQQQGFNRSFCGKNATMYGKGVYFARDASYSAHPIYAVPDKKGHQYMMACRVVVGEYCMGRQDALTPDVRDHKSHSLYDSTVGLKGNDTMTRPTIFVTYHDAQAYPEYLITFKSSGDVQT